MTRRLSPVAVLAASLLSLPAHADSKECKVALDVWDLELTRVEALEGDADLQALASALGTQARLRGGWRDPSHSKAPVRAELVGSTDGAGLTVSLQKRDEP